MDTQIAILLTLRLFAGLGTIMVIIALFLAFFAAVANPPRIDAAREHANRAAWYLLMTLIAYFGSFLVAGAIAGGLVR